MSEADLFIDERLVGVCAYCGAKADSKGHVPSKTLLDEPYPPNLPTADSCQECNHGFSASEEYLSCLIECVVQGTTTPSDKFRAKVAATLKVKPAISQKIETGKTLHESGGLIWQPDWNCVREVVIKLARGHIAHELGFQRTDEPMVFEVSPIASMSDIEYQIFNSLDDEAGLLYPEIGSRAFIGMFSNKETAYGAWRIVQPGRYRYAIGQSSGDWVRLVISEYLACRVAWD